MACLIRSKDKNINTVKKNIWLKTTLVLFCLSLTGATIDFSSSIAAADFPKIEHMSFVDAPVGYILQSLGRMYNMNFSISTSAATRKVSIEFNNISFHQAVEMISISSGIIVKRHEDKENFYVVQTQEEQLPTSSEEERQRAIQENALKNLVTEVVTVKFVSVGDVENVVKQTLGTETGSLVKIAATSNVADRNYSSLLLSAPGKEIMETIKKIIRTIDIPKPMVEMEVMFVELVKSNNESGGADLNLFKNPFEFKEVNAPALDELFIPTSPLSFGKIYRMTPWEAEATIQAIKGSSKSRVLADPKIRVMSGRQAIFSSETQVPILSRNSDGEVNTEWKNVGIHIDIMPIVLDDGTILVKTAPRSSSITGEKKLGDVVAPVISERKAETEVIMNPGETMIIGGLMNDREIKSLSKVPFLSDIPLIGPLFRSARTENEQSTIVIFLRPHIIDTVDSQVVAGDVIIGNKDHETAKRVLNNPRASHNPNNRQEMEEYFKSLKSEYGALDSTEISEPAFISQGEVEVIEHEQKTPSKENKKTGPEQTTWIPPVD